MKRIRLSAVVILLSLAAVPVLRAQNASRPDLVVFIAVDQFRQDYLERFADQFTGGLKRLREHGAYFTNAFQDHAVTYTAVGHSTMLSGRFPRSTGIISNELGVPDPAARMLNGIGAGASPFRFRGSTLIDWLRVHDPLSRALSISVKDRAAILPMGRARQSVFWYSADGTFSTSNYYADTLPTWLRSFNARRLPEQYAAMPWTLLLPEKMYAEADSVAVENGGRNLTFPHKPPADVRRAVEGLANYPWMDQLVLQAALTGIDSMKLGHNGHIDLLSASLSTMDFIGHAYGTDSREVHDQVVRLDRTLGAFLDSLDKRFQPGRYVVVLTADHGVTPYAELRASELKGGNGHIDIAPVTAALREWIRSRNIGTTAFDIEGGMLILDPDALHHNHALMDSLAGMYASAVRKLPGVLRVDYVRDLARGDTLNDKILRRWNQMIPRDLEIPVVATPLEGFIWSARTSSTHGTPWDADAHVPIIFYGPQFKSGRYPTFARTVDIAPTLAALLRIHPTEVLDGKPLRQILK